MGVSLWVSRGVSWAGWLPAVWLLVVGLLGGCVSTIEGNIVLDPVSAPVQSYLAQQRDVSYAGRVNA